MRILAWVTIGYILIVEIKPISVCVPVLPAPAAFRIGPFLQRPEGRNGWGSVVQLLAASEQTSMTSSYLWPGPL